MPDLLTDERLAELLRHRDMQQQVREANGLAGDPDVVAALRELQAYREECREWEAAYPLDIWPEPTREQSAAHPFGERIAAGMARHTARMIPERVARRCAATVAPRAAPGAEPG